MLRAQSLRSEGQLGEAGSFLSEAESLIRSDEDRYWWHCESALQIVAKYEDTYHMDRRAPLEECEAALSHLDQAREIRQRAGTELDPEMAKFRDAVGMVVAHRHTQKELAEAEQRKKCFVATAVYGSPMAQEVQVLQHYRDAVLTSSPLGRALVRLYEEVGPRAASLIEGREGTKTLIRACLLRPLVCLARFATRRHPGGLDRHGR
jgi:hypothetical protein